ncbi:hypothetical protein CLF_103714 [Clonorchis sinensis]|uniref:Saposin B-type domain-containing protein n=1 Tax=Clonorchis sinensis TaxID=79923 RepID=G7YNK3_CLOSI|nr:hypothetical protein CLF_103714 [Clonorchis sinensis]
MLSTTSKLSRIFAILILTDLPNAIVCVPVAQEIPWTRLLSAGSTKNSRSLECTVCIWVVELLQEAALSQKADAINRELTDYICSLQTTDPEELFTCEVIIYNFIKILTTEFHRLGSGEVCQQLTLCLTPNATSTWREAYSVIHHLNTSRIAGLKPPT